MPRLWNYLRLGRGASLDTTRSSTPPAVFLGRAVPALSNHRLESWTRTTRAALSEESMKFHFGINKAERERAWR